MNKKSLKRRYAAERRFKIYGISAIAIALSALVVLFGNIFITGIPAFQQTMMNLSVDLDESKIGSSGEKRTGYRAVVNDAIFELFPNVTDRAEKRKLLAIVSPGASQHINQEVIKNPTLAGQQITFSVPVSDDFDQLAKGNIGVEQGRVSKQQVAWFQQLVDQNQIENKFNWSFFTNGDSRSPELAGIRGAIAGSFWTILITMALSFPIGVATALYLEEFAPKNRFTDIIEVNINNLAAVPSIVFGLLGLAVFLGFFGLPRSAPLVGGIVLSLMSLPTVIIAGRATLKSVPPSIREAALGVGASPVQMVFHHVLPLAMPGMITGSILALARALGETAPLLMIGMVAFIVDVPAGPLDPATVMPVQIFLWFDLPERAFIEKASAAIVVLTLFLFVVQVLAIFLRRKFETKW